MNQIRRRQFLVAGGALLIAPLAADAQQPQKVRRIGFFGNAPSSQVEAFRQGLRDLGWVEGQNMILEYRWMQGRPERLPELAEELVSLRLDVILAASSTQVEAVRQETRTPEGDSPRRDPDRRAMESHDTFAFPRSEGARSAGGQAQGEAADGRG